jgi:hypothetical protein
LRYLNFLFPGAIASDSPEWKAFALYVLTEQAESVEGLPLPRAAASVVLMGSGHEQNLNKTASALLQALTSAGILIGAGMDVVPWLEMVHYADAPDPGAGVLLWDVSYLEGELIKLD